MASHNRLTTVLIGGGNALIRCAEVLLDGGHEVCGLLSTDLSVRRWAKEKDLLTVETLKDLVTLSRRRPFDYLFSIVNDEILPEEILALPRRAAINFHDALLPRYAGIHSTSWALMKQETVHGVTWHRMSAEIDAGEILKQREFRVADHETAFTLNAKCFDAAIGSFAELIDDLSEDRVSARPQAGGERSYFPRFQRPPAACVFSLRLSAEEIDAFVRGLDFGPYANPLGLPKLILGREPFVVSELSVVSALSDSPPGTVTGLGPDSLQVATATKQIVIRKLLTVGGQALSIEDAVGRQGLKPGDQIPELEPTLAERLTERNASICKHEAFWVKRLEELRPIELPYADGALPSRSPQDFLATTLPLPAEVTNLLANRREEWGMGEFLLAAFGAFLARLGSVGPFDIGFRSLDLQRELAGLESFFETRVPLRLEVNVERSFSSAFEAVQDAVALAKREQTYARDAVSRYPALRSRSELRRERFWPVMAEQVERLGDEGRPDAVLTLVIAEEAPVCRWIHDPDALSPDSITRISDQFTTFLRGIAANPDRSLADLPILTQAESHRLLIEWNDTAREYPKNQCIHRLFENQAEQTPEAVAVVFESHQLTYRELNQRANQLANLLRQMGVGPQVLVGLCVDRSLEMVVALLAILKAGGAYVPLDPSYPRERLAFMIEDARLSLLLTQDHLAGELPKDGTRILRLDSEWARIAETNAENPVGGASAEDLAYVIYTSGSTGKPKGVEISHRAVVNFLNSMRQSPGLTSQDTLFSVTSLSFDIAALEIYLPLIVGARSVVVGRDVASDGTRLMKALASSHATVMQATPATWRMLLDAGWPGSDRLRILCGGEALPRELANQLLARSAAVWNLYGPTETTIWSTLYRADIGDGSIPIGRPIANTKIYILDGHLRPLPVGVAGELYIGGAGLARGYFRRPELTLEKFITSPFAQEPGDRLYRTGDLARYLPDGNIEYLGRIDQQVKIRGFRIELGEIEAVLSQHPGVREAVVIAREDQPGTKSLAAYLIAAEQAPTVEGLRGFLKEKLPDYMVPGSFVFLKAFPLTPNGKVDRRALPVPDQTRPELGKAYEAPRDELELRLSKIWEKVLSVRPIGVHDNFFELGGNSLLAGRLFAQIQRMCRKDLSPIALFQAPTIEQLAPLLRSAQSPSWSSLVPIQSGGSRPPLFCMHAGAGTILFYHDLARRLGPDQPIYGLQAQGLYGKVTPHATVEEMAAHYIQEIRTVQPDGPYQLAGFCFGATLAFEMAQQLRAAGFEVGLLASFDGGRPGYRYRSPSSRRLSLPYPKSRRQWFFYHLAHVRLFGPGYVAEKIADRWIQFWRMHFYRFGRRRAEQDRPLPAVVRRSFFLYNHAFAEHSYRPRPYPGKMVVFETKGLFPDPELGWDELVTGGVEIHEISGDHKLHRDLMAGKFVIGLADRLNKYLAEGAPGPRKAQETATIPGRVGWTSGAVETKSDPDLTRAPRERPRAAEETPEGTRVPA